MTWEYMVREFNVQDSDKILLLEEFLNETGKDGWELVSVAMTPTVNYTHLVYLKRPAALTERMRKFAHDAEEMVRNTPTAAELKKLCDRDNEGRSTQPEGPEVLYSPLSIIGPRRPSPETSGAATARK